MKYYYLNSAANMDSKISKKTCSNRISMLESVILTLVFVFFTADSLVFGSNASAFFVRIKYLFFYATFFYLLIKSNKLIKKNSFSLLAIFIGTISISMVINSDLRLGYIQKMIVIIASYLYCQLYSLKKFAFIYTRIMVFLVGSSLAFEVCYLTLPKLVRIFTLTNVAGNSFNTWFIASLPTMPGGVIRNFGFAREPGVFAIFIILALLFETFVNEEKSIKIIVVFVIGLLTTISTSGYIALALYLIALLIYIEKFNFTNKNKIRLMLFLLFCFILYLALKTDMLFGEQYGSVFGKLYNRGNGTDGSFNARFASIISNVYIGFQNIMFGKGITYVDENFSNVSWQILQVNVKDNANTLFIHLAQYGIIFFSTQCVCLVRTIKDFSTSKLINAFCLFAYLAVAMGQTLIASPIFFIMLFLRNEEKEKCPSTSS